MSCVAILLLEELHICWCTRLVQVVGVKSAGETAKCKQVYCDPTYVRLVEFIVVPLVQVC